MVNLTCIYCFFFFKQKTAYEMRISDWSSDVCSSDLIVGNGDGYGGRLDHLVYRCKARRLAEHHVGRANIEAIPSLRPDDAVKHIAAEYRRIRNLDLLPMPKGWTLVRPAWILELGTPAPPVV